jgi:MFS family permease
MRYRWDHFFSNPGRLHRVSQAMIALSAVIAFFAAYLREGRSAGSTTYLIDVAALLMAIGSAVFDGQYASILGDFQPKSLRRGSLLRLAIGVLGMLLGCVVASMDLTGSSSALIKSIAYGLLFAGIALALGGAVRILLVDGAYYASEKVQERLDDDY